MLELKVEQQFGQIGLMYTPLRYDLDIRPPDLTIEQKAAELSLEQPAAILEIDYTPARESLGYLGITSRMTSFVQDAKATHLAGLDRRVEQGRQLGAIEEQISIGEIAARSLEPVDKQLMLDKTQPVDIEVTTRQVNGDISPGGVTGSFTLGDVQSDLTYGRVNTYLERQPYVKIHTVGSAVDQNG